MVVTVIAVRMVQTTIDDVIDMIAMRDRLVTAAGAMHVATCVAGGEPVVTTVRIGLADRDHVLVIVDQTVNLVWMVQVAVVQIVDVIVVAHGLMTTVGTVLMIMVRVGMAVLAHR